MIISESLTNVVVWAVVLSSRIIPIVVGQALVATVTGSITKRPRDEELWSLHWIECSTVIDDISELFIGQGAVGAEELVVSPLGEG